MTSNADDRLLFMLRELDNATLAKGRIMASAQRNMSRLAQYQTGRATILRETPKRVMDHVIESIPLGRIQHEGLTVPDATGSFDPLGEAATIALNEAMIITCLAVYHRDILDPTEYAALVEAWNMVLDFPDGAEPTF